MELLYLVENVTFGVNVDALNRDLAADSRCYHISTIALMALCHVTLFKSCVGISHVLNLPPRLGPRVYT